MAKVTSKLQVTIPKAVADLYGIKPGGEVEWQPAGEVIRVIPRVTRKKGHETKNDLERSLKSFDQATDRQRRRDATWTGRRIEDLGDRGWKREDLYGRGLPR